MFSSLAGQNRENMNTENVYMVDWVSKTEAQLSNLKETIVVKLTDVKFLDFNRMFASIKNQ